MTKKLKDAVFADKRLKWSLLRMHAQINADPETALLIAARVSKKWCHCFSSTASMHADVNPKAEFLQTPLDPGTGQRTEVSKRSPGRKRSEVSAQRRPHVGQIRRLRIK